jgi:uncharacterized protein YgiM (DUF1202 family)
MKKMLVGLALMLALNCAAWAAGGQETGLKAGSSAWVSSKTLDIKDSAKNFAADTGTLNYGQEISVLQVSGKWVQVRSKSGLSGWVASSGLTSKRITGTSGSATASEIALAGKGFSEEIEDAYKAEATDLDYLDVDNIEGLRVDEDALYDFLVQGSLRGAE